jgi:hypothetical protein
VTRRRRPSSPVRGGSLREMMGEPPMFPFYATLSLSTSW